MDTGSAPLVGYRREEGSRSSVLGRHDVRNVPELSGRRQPGKGEL